RIAAGVLSRTTLNAGHTRHVTRRLSPRRMSLVILSGVPMRPYPVLVLLAMLASTPASAQDALPADFDQYVAGVMSDHGVPGMAIAVVKDGAAVLAKVYGVRERGKPAPVDDQTLFGIASNTKAFSATALALLVEDGKLEWDEPVITYLPWFRLSDA